MVSEPPKTNIMTIVPKIAALSKLGQVSLPNYTFPFKFKQDNYVMWKNQILLVIIGSNLEGFVTRGIKEQYKFMEK